MLQIILQKDYKSILKTLKGDFLGGIISAIVALPQALAFGIATGLGASAGIWGAIFLCFFAGIFGPNASIISGPTGPCAIVIASIMASGMFDVQKTITIMILASVIQLIISLTKLSEIIKYVPYPVISGFMNGVGAILIILQISPLFGKRILSSPIDTILSVPSIVSSPNFEAIGLGVLTLIICFAIPKKWNKIIPSQLIALVLCTFIAINYNFDVDKIGTISMSFPKLNMPLIGLEDLINMLPLALTLAIVCSTETLLAALVVDSLSKKKLETEPILAAQGLGNLISAMTGSLIGAGASMRSAAAIKTGAETKLAALINPIILLFIVSKLLAFTEQIPLPVLAGILIKIGFDIIDTKFLKVIKYAPKDDLYVLILVFFLTVFYNLIFAIGCGITLAALLYAKRVADRTNIEVKTVKDLNILQLEKQLEKDYQYKIRVVHIDGQFFFGSATQIISQFEELLGTKYLIINYEDKNLLDISAVFALEDIIIRLQSQKIKSVLVIKNSEVLNQLKDLKIVSQIGEENIFYNEIEAIDYCKTHIEEKIKRKIIQKIKSNIPRLWKNEKK